MSIVKRYRMSKATVLPAVLFFLSLFFINDLPAYGQGADSVWYMEWARYAEGPDGNKIKADPFQIWFDAERLYVIVDEETHFTIVNDSLYIINDFHKNYSSGPSDQLDMAWITNLELTWKRRRAPKVEFNLLGDTKYVKQILGREMRIFLRGNQLMYPMRLDLFVAQEDEVPVPPDAIQMVYTAIGAAHTDISIDYMEISDTLRSRGLIPLTTRLIALGPKEKSGVVSMELDRLEKVAVPSNYFLPPSNYSGNVMRTPTKSERWELTAIPLPGGPRKE